MGLVATMTVSSSLESFKLLSLTTLALSQHKDSLSRYGIIHYKDKTVVRSFYLYYGNYYAGKLVSLYTDHPWYLQFCKAHVTLCRSFFADVPNHRRPPRSVMIVTKPSDHGLNSRSLSVQDCMYDFSMTAVRHWYDGNVWSALSTFSTTISTTTDMIDTTALTTLTTTPTLLTICYDD